MLVTGVVGLRAQTQLPGITVVTPSPVTKPKPQPAPPDVAAPPPAGLIIEDAFVPLTVVPSDLIIGTPGATLTDALQTKPGIIGSTFAPGANRPVIRGFDNFRVRVQEGGIGSHDVTALSEDHAVPIDPGIIDRIEVVRGPATLRYGSQAIGGVVNAITSRIPEAIPPKGISLETRGGFGSVDRGTDGVFKVSAGSGNIVVYADAFKRHAGDYDTPLGRQLNSFVESEGFAFGSSYVGKNGYIGIAFSQFNSLYGIPGEDAADERARIDLKQDKLLSRGEWRVGSYGVETIRFWLGSSWYKHDEIHFEAGPPEVGSRFSNRQTEGRVEVQHLPVVTTFGELRGAAGVHFGHKRTTALSFEGDGLLDPARTDSVAAFIFEELQVTPTCAELTIGCWQIKALAEKSALHFRATVGHVWTAPCGQARSGVATIAVGGAVMCLACWCSHSHGCWP